MVAGHRDKNNESLSLFFSRHAELLQSQQRGEQEKVFGQKVVKSLCDSLKDLATREKNYECKTIKWKSWIISK